MRLYDTTLWRRFRKWYLQQHPICVMCEKTGRTEPAVHVDHVIPHKGDPVKFWEGPFQGLCVSHHSAKTRSEQTGKPVVTVDTTGAPDDWQ